MTNTVGDSIPGLPSAEHRSLDQNQFGIIFLRVAPAMFLGTLDQTIVAAALPAIAGALGGLSSISWIVTAYLLAATIASPLYGRMGDAFGRRKMLLVALLLFIAGSIACGLAASASMLICFRALQGLGGGGLMTLSQAVIGEAVSPRERGRFQGWFGATFALASTIGPVAGGILAQYLGWRSIFWVNVPLGVGALYAAWRVPSSAGSGKCTLDYGGTSFFVVSTLALLLMLSLGGQAVAWGSPATIGLCILSGLGFAMFFKIERKTSDPLIPMQLLEDPIVWRASLTVLLFAAVLFGLIVELPLFFQAVLGTSASVSGLLLVPLTLAQVTVSTITGLCISKTGRPRNAMAISLSIVTLGFIALSAGVSSGRLVICLLTLIVGAGLGSTMPVAQTMVQWAAGESQLGIATGEVTLSRSIGAVFGTTIASAIVFGLLRVYAPGSTSQMSALTSGLGGGAIRATSFSEPLITSFRWLFLTLGALSAVASVVAWSIPNIDLSSSPANVNRSIPR